MDKEAAREAFLESEKIRIEQAELKPCPFCGMNDVSVELTVTERSVRCRNCGANIVRDSDDLQHPAIVWNSRAGYEAAGGWHRIEDGLPEEDGEYLVHTRYFAIVGYEIWYYEDAVGSIEQWKQKVIAWMPIPNFEEAR